MRPLVPSSPLGGDVGTAATGVGVGTVATGVGVRTVATGVSVRTVATGVSVRTGATAVSVRTGATAVSERTGATAVSERTVATGVGVWLAGKLLTVLLNIGCRVDVERFGDCLGTGDFGSEETIGDAALACPETGSDLEAGGAAGRSCVIGGWGR
ncbi:hypothetical protein HNQ77_001580 [Silvibacterium bohemicum]|uniref:Uncharacterized protein n=1 Tax=Silvibacterium bohemicum TaxID=1577686 RepID=A0A841JXB6_9BACT|nr:hypothetical protein [Silvibacterium bohemicum]MBB6143631.1 hypothetical protein [Silvibacterium bohemicum]